MVHDQNKYNLHALLQADMLYTLDTVISVCNNHHNNLTFQQWIAMSNKQRVALFHQKSNWYKCAIC